MRDICDEVVRRREGERARVDVSVRFTGVSASVYNNDRFCHAVELALVPNTQSFDIVYNGMPDVIAAVAASIGEGVYRAALARGIRTAIVETSVVARCGPDVVLDTAASHNMMHTADNVLALLARVKALAENLVTFSP